MNVLPLKSLFRASNNFIKLLSKPSKVYLSLNLSIRFNKFLSIGVSLNSLTDIFGAFAKVICKLSLSSIVIFFIISDLPLTLTVSPISYFLRPLIKLII